jgi:hypothetical protein
MKELGEDGSRTRESLRELRGEGAEHGQHAARTDDEQRRGQEPRPLALALRRAPRAHEREPLARAEAVSLDDERQRLLVRAAHAAERQRQGHTQGGAVDALGDFGRELRREQLARFDPPSTLPQQPRNAHRAEPVLHSQRVDDARLVHGRDRPARRIGREHERPRLGARARALDHHGDALRAGRAPAREALVPVDDDVALLRAGHDAQGELGEIVGPFAAAPAQQRIRRVDRRDRHPAHALARGARAHHLRRGALCERLLLRGRHRGSAHDHERWWTTRWDRQHLVKAVDRVRPEGRVGNEPQVHEAAQRARDLAIVQPKRAPDPIASVEAHALPIGDEAQERVDGDRADRHGLEPPLMQDPGVDPPERRPAQVAHAIRARHHHTLRALTSHESSSRWGAQGRNSTTSCR